MSLCINDKLLDHLFFVRLPSVACPQADNLVKSKLEFLMARRGRVGNSRKKFDPFSLKCRSYVKR